MTGGEDGWSARYRFDPLSGWRECRIVDLSFEGATVELDDIARGEAVIGKLDLEISSIASDQVGVTLRTVIRGADRLPAGRVVVDVGFAHWRREESLLLHLLVGLRNYV
jgi:hypothetical protein